MVSAMMCMVAETQSVDMQIKWADQVTAFKDLAIPSDLQFHLLPHTVHSVHPSAIETK